MQVGSLPHPVPLQPLRLQAWFGGSPWLAVGVSFSLLNIYLECLSPPYTSYLVSILLCMSSGTFSLLAPTRSIPSQGDFGGSENKHLSFQQPVAGVRELQI